MRNFARRRCDIIHCFDAPCLWLKHLDVLVHLGSGNIHRAGVVCWREIAREFDLTADDTPHRCVPITINIVALEVSEYLDQPSHHIQDVRSANSHAK